jgi:hypothetical protein
MVGGASLRLHLHRNTTVSIFTYTSHDKLVKVCINWKYWLLLYAPGGAVAPATAHTLYTPVPPVTLLTVICEMSCEQNTLLAAVVKVIAAGSVVVTDH